MNRTRREPLRSCRDHVTFRVVTDRSGKQRITSLQRSRPKCQVRQNPFVDLLQPLHRPIRRSSPISYSHSRHYSPSACSRRCSSRSRLASMVGNPVFSISETIASFRKRRNGLCRAPVASCERSFLAPATGSGCRYKNRKAFYSFTNSAGAHGPLMRSLATSNRKSTISSSRVQSQKLHLSSHPLLAANTDPRHPHKAIQQYKSRVMEVPPFVHIF